MGVYTFFKILAKSFLESQRGNFHAIFWMNLQVPLWRRSHTISNSKFLMIVVLYFYLPQPITIFIGLNFISLPTFSYMKLKIIKMDYSTATNNVIHNLAPAPYIICIIVQQY